MTENLNETVRDLSAAGLAVKEVPAADGRTTAPFVIIPNGYSVSDLEKLLSAPLRIKANPAMIDPASFISYVNDFKGESTRIFATEKASSLVAHLDHPAKGAPSWSDHKASLALQQTPEWLAWVGIHRKPIAQVAFAEFIEEHTKEIITPDGNTMLEIALTLQDNRKATVKSAVRLDNGMIKFAWEEEGSAMAGKDGGAEIPKSFTIAVSPFKGCDPYKVEVLLRYRVSKEEGLSFTCVLKDYEKVKETVFREVLARIEHETAIKPLLS